MTTVNRVYNFHRGRRFCRCRCSKKSSATCSPCHRSACRSSRSAIARRRSSRSSRRPRPMCARSPPCPANYKVLFLQGGASPQFSMVPMNLLTAGATADYIDAGSWGDKAIKEAKKVGTVNVAASTKAENYSRVPAQAELKLTPGAAYVHMTSNNTIEGTEYKALPDVGDVPLVNDTSSDMFSRPIDVAQHGLIYAGAQKNLGPSGVTLVDHPRGSAARRSQKTLPTMLNYAGAGGERIDVQHAAGLRGLHARPRHEVADRAGRARGDGGDQRAQGREAATPRSTAPASTAEPPHRDCRSLMNVTFRLAIRGTREARSSRSRPPPASTASRATGRSAACAPPSTTPSRSGDRRRWWPSCASSRRTSG